MPLDAAAKINWDKIRPKGMAIKGTQSLLAPFLCPVCVWYGCMVWCVCVSVNGFIVCMWHDVCGM